MKPFGRVRSACWQLLHRGSNTRHPCSGRGDCQRQRCGVHDSALSARHICSGHVPGQRDRRRAGWQVRWRGRDSSASAQEDLLRRRPSTPRQTSWTSPRTTPSKPPHRRPHPGRGVGGFSGGRARCCAPPEALQILHVYGARNANELTSGGTGMRWSVSNLTGHNFGREKVRGGDR
jgi:hypothetical protein